MTTSTSSTVTVRELPNHLYVMLNIGGKGVASYPKRRVCHSESRSVTQTFPKTRDETLTLTCKQNAIHPTVDGLIGILRPGTLNP